MKFSDIPKVTGDGLYNVNVEWRDLLETLEHYQDSRDGLCVLDLDPDFQRGYVWTEAQQIAYVEYRLKGGGAGVNRILFNCVGHMGSYLGPFQIVDGKQRLKPNKLASMARQKKQITHSPLKTVVTPSNHQKLG